MELLSLELTSDGGAGVVPTRDHAILLVEDEADHAELVCRAFRDQDPPVQLTVAGSIADAREQVGRSIPDLIIADLCLPDGCGTELLRNELLVSSCPIVILTAHGDEMTAVETLRNGAWDYVVKSSATLRDMPHIVSNAIEQWNRRRERQLLDDGMRQVEECVAGATSDTFFQSLVDVLAKTLDVDAVFALAIRPAGEDGMDEIAVSHDGGDVATFCERLERTACGYVAGRQSLCIPRNARERFPMDALLKEFNVEGCAGTPLVDSHNIVLGTLMLISCRRLRRPELVSSLLSVSAVRASAELERQRLDAERERIQQRLLHHERTERQHVERELQKVKTELVRSTRMAALGEVAAQIAHEMRNSLGAVRNAAYYLRTCGQAAPEWQEYLKIIDDEVVQCGATIRGLLDATRIKRIRRETVDLGEMVRDEFLHAHIAPTIVCRFHSDPTPFRISVDPIQWRRVMNNMLANARDAVGPAGWIDISAERRESVDVITYRDSGPGVAPEHRKMIFELLFTTKADGSGIGLTICRQVVEQHEGSLRLVETPDGRTAFVIHLPHVTT